MFTTKKQYKFTAKTSRDTRLLPLSLSLLKGLLSWTVNHPVLRHWMKTSIRSSLLSGWNVRWPRHMLPPGESSRVYRWDKWSDARPLHYALCYGHGQCNEVQNHKKLNHWVVSQSVLSNSTLWLKHKILFHKSHMFTLQSHVTQKIDRILKNRPIKFRYCSLV